MTVVGEFASNALANAGGNITLCPPVSHLQASALSLNRSADINDFLYSATMTLSDAIASVQKRHYSWATCKLYYATFYSIRALLLCYNVGIFYDGSKPGVLIIRPGATLRKPTNAEAKGGTHGLVLNLFSKMFPTHRLLTEVNGENPMFWLKSRREEVNYTIPRFVEPGCPIWFEKSFGKNSLRKVISSYTADNLLYAFDPDHALFALPLLSLQSAIEESNRLGFTMDADDRAYLASTLRDQDGILATLTKYLKLT
jgi:hypothetical protein